MDRPFAPACERNKKPILEKLKEAFADVKTVLEIGSGTGQHAIYFAEHLPHLVWQTSDLEFNHESILSWIESTKLENVLSPLAVNVNDEEWPVHLVDAVFSSNITHIVSWPEVEKMFAGIARVLKTNGILCLYGPFNYYGEYTSQSNAQFDQMLKIRDPLSGIRDFADLQTLAQRHGLTLQEDYEMPANNRLLYWKRVPLSQ